jgi:hypothetical protein
MISTYDSSDEDKSNSWAHVESTYEQVDTSNHTCGTVTELTGECDSDPISLDWVAATGFPYYNEYNVNVTVAGTFNLNIEDGRKVTVQRHPTGPTISGEGTYEGPQDVTISVHDTGLVDFFASAYDASTYTDTEIGTATDAMIESAMTQYGRVVFAPGTWKIYRVDLSAIGGHDEYIHIGTNPNESGKGYVDAADCDGSNDEVQWNAALDNYKYAYIGSNTDGYYLEDYVVAGRQMGELSDSTATAQPLVILNSVEVYGDEETLTPPRPTGTSSLEYPDYQFMEFRQTLSRPGGGAWSLADINSLEAGIVLGNVLNPIAGDDTRCGYEAKNIPCCTQIYAEVLFWPSDFDIVTTGFTQYGIRVFDNGLDEWGLKVYDTNGLNLYTHKVYRSSIAVYFARGKQLLQGITNRLLHRRRTSSAMGRGRTSIGVAE